MQEIRGNPETARNQHRAWAAYRWAEDVTVNVAENERRTGVGRRLYGELLPLLTRQGFNVVHAGIALPNARSLGLHQRLGFCHTGAFASAA